MNNEWSKDLVWRGQTASSMYQIERLPNSQSNQLQLLDGVWMCLHRAAGKRWCCRVFKQCWWVGSLHQEYASDCASLLITKNLDGQQENTTWLSVGQPLLFSYFGHCIEFRQVCSKVYRMHQISEFFEDTLKSVHIYGTWDALSWTWLWGLAKFDLPPAINIRTITRSI